MWARKSASVRVGPTEGQMTSPVTTSKLIMNDSVPWRMYSNSRRSTLPGRSGKPGAARSKAWTPVISSVLMTRSPSATRAVASRYVPHTSAIFPSRSSDGSSAAGVSQYRIRCGLRSAAFEQPPRVARRDRLNDAPPHDLIGQLTVAPLADRSVRVCGRLARQGDNLAHLLRRELCRRTLSWGIGQPLRHAEVIQGYVSKLQPALPPEARRLVIQSEPPRDLCIVLPIASRENDPCARDQLLTSSVGAYQALQIHSLALTQHNIRGSQ